MSSAYLLAIEHTYQSARASAQIIQDRYIVDGGSAGLTAENLPTLTEDLRRLEADLSSLQGLVDAPLLGRIARHSPLVGEDIEASQQFVEIGREMAAIARDATLLADEARLAFESSGMAVSDSPGGPTWLDVVAERMATIESLEQRFDAVLVMRAGLDETHLPANARAMLPEVDRLLEKATELRDEYAGLLPLLDTAFGGQEPANYVLLLQNREEIRPGGGFPGTFATVTLRNGQLETYDIFDIRTLDGDYVANRSAEIPSPGPIREILGQEEYLPHDALWSPDFHESAQTFAAMYAVAGWPDPAGVIGIDDSVVATILTIVGPYPLEIDGQPYTISADNFMDLIESQRDLTWQDLAAHKRFVAILGSSLIEQVKGADYATKKQIYFALREAADRRQVQVQMIDPTMQAEVARRRWDGALNPDPSLPTLATTVAGLTGGKKALMLYQDSQIEIAPLADGYEVRWTITLDHRGDPSGNEVYNGYEYAWLSFYLPEGARLVSTSREPADKSIADDPRATSFGIGIMPATTQQTTVVFEIAATDQLLLRRQAGFNDAEVRIAGDTGSCVIDWSLTLSRDMLVDLTTCSAFPARD